jgi:hypothetical protein
MRVFNYRGSMVECSRRIDEPPFCACQYVVQIPSPVWTEVNRSSSQKLRGNSRDRIRPHVADEREVQSLKSRCRSTIIHEGLQVNHKLAASEARCGWQDDRGQKVSVRRGLGPSSRARTMSVQQAGDSRHPGIRRVPPDQDARISSAG